MVSNTQHYKSNLRDVFFNLFEVLNIQDDVLGKKPFTVLDESMAKETMKTFETLCVQKIATSFKEGDEVPLRLTENGDVIIPDGIKQALKDFFEGEWHRIDMPEELGGVHAPRSIYWSAFEFLVGANPPVALYLFSSFASRLIQDLGTESQKKRFVNNILDNCWGATMVLTEAEAGSDVGSSRTKAKHIEGEEWEIEGVKRFITNGDFDSAENILHLVLARPEGAEAGTKGLSLFLVPKFWVDEEGKKVGRNGVYCTNLEKKMGIKASATCEMTFGEKEPAKGLLLGNAHKGIRQMFKVIEQARMAVGVKSMSTLSTAYLNALDFCKDRVQGPDLAKIMDKDSPRVKIIRHPDVRRMLMLQKSFAEGMRALCYYCAYIEDLEIIARAEGDEKKAKSLHLLSDLMLPLIKGYNSEKAYEILAVSLQCYGGSGYLKDYPIEQYIRDQKIDSLYEGTTHIQSLDLIFRKIAKNGAATLQRIFDDMEKTLSEKKQPELLKNEYEALAGALKEAQSIMGLMMGKMAESFYNVGLLGNRILLGIAELAIAWLMIRHAEVAAEKVASAAGDDKHFYQGKIASCQFYCQQTLPNLAVTRSMIEKSNLSLMEISDEAF